MPKFTAKLLNIRHIFIHCPVFIPYQYLNILYLRVISTDRISGRTRLDGMGFVGVDDVFFVVGKEEGGQGRAIIIPINPRRVPHTERDRRMTAGLRPMTLPMIFGVRI